MLLGKLIPNQDKVFFGSAIGQRLQEQCARETKYDRIRSERDRQHRNGEKGEAACSAEPMIAGPNVLPCLLDKTDAAGVTAFFFASLELTDGKKRSMSRLDWKKTGGLQLQRFLFKVELQLLVQFLFQPAALDERPDSERHDPNPLFPIHRSGFLQLHHP